MTNYDNALFKQGLLHLKAGETSMARRYFERALDTADDNQTRAAACDHLSRLADDPVQKRAYLEQLLAFDPVHPEARRALAILDERLTLEDVIDPDDIPAPAPDAVDVHADRFTCPRCGGRMVYTSDGKSLTCEFCDRRQKLAGGSSGEQDFFAAMASARGHQVAASAQIFHCQGCGAEFFLGAREISTACTWCGSLYVVRQDRTLPAPDSILPFTLDREEVKRKLQDWMKEHSLPLQNGLPPLRPLYLPAWCFSILGTTPWSGQHYQQQRPVQVSGEEALYLTDLVVLAVKDQPRLFSSLLKGYDFSTADSYDPRFLVGWQAQVPSVALADAALEARRMAVEQVRRSLVSRHGDVRNLKYGTSNLAVDTFRLVLVPVWLVEIPTEGASITAALNGISADVYADPPMQ